MVRCRSCVRNANRRDYSRRLTQNSPDGSRTCRGCGVPLTETNWPEYARRHGAIRCLRCILKTNRRYYDRDRHRLYNRKNAWKEKGILITEAEYQALRAEQSGRCAICERPEGKRRLQVDHDHQSGEIRGLLCPSCNAALGALNDSAELLERALDYLTPRDYS